MGKWEKSGVAMATASKVLPASSKHLTEILEPFCVRIHRQDFLCMFCSEIHVAECDHIDHACFSEVVYDLFAAVAYSDIGYLYLTALR